MIECYVFDIDGTIANLSHRLHYIQVHSEEGDIKPNWDAFFDECNNDAPIDHIIELAIDLYTAGRHIVYVSGRSDQIRDKTLVWLNNHQLPNGALYMRKQGDHRPDDMVKLDLLKELKADGYHPILAFDDRDQVVRMWRLAGIPCAQVADGDF